MSAPIHEIPVEALLAELHRRRDALTREAEAWDGSAPRHRAILDRVAAAHGLTRADLFSDTRRQPIAGARQMAMAALATVAGLTRAEVATIFHCDPSTVTWAVTKHQVRMEATDRESIRYGARWMASVRAGDAPEKSRNIDYR
jgi:chromosomal replication initiation ATPase DnaA